jgi:hypothetical protein
MMISTEDTRLVVIEADKVDDEEVIIVSKNKSRVFSNMRTQVSTFQRRLQHCF